MKEEIRQILAAEAKAIRQIPVNDHFGKAVELIYQSVHKNGGKVVASGMGKAGQIALNIATTFSSTGTPAIFLHPSDAQHGDLGVISDKDILLLVTNSGKTREIVELYELSKGLVPHIPVVVITGNLYSPLGSIADVTIHTGGPDEICPLGLTPTTSTTVMTVIGDILVVLLMKKIGFSAKDYAKRHHGGYLGIQSRNALKG
ncbi:MAG: iron dicitrate transport regulator FecR, partial [Bacteroidetes bacterium]|nr:iron dicitrate transport regulator FecR [Bacteroidota bacterium]